MQRPDVCQPTGSAELPMLDIYLPMMKSAALISAAQLGLFEALSAGPLEPGPLAQRLGCDGAGTRALADFLVALGFLEPSGAGYANTPSTQRWFTSAGQVDYTPGALWTHEAWAMMGDLAVAVREGRPRQTLWEQMGHQPHLGPLFSRYMQAFARHLGPDLVAHAPVQPHHRRLLDLGGSHGLHSARFCEQHPQMQAVIVDMPAALTHTGATLAEVGLAERVTLRPGNLLDLDWGGRYDVVLYLSVGHNQQAEDNRRVIAEIARCLEPGGLLVIHDYLAGRPMDAYNSAFRLTLLFETGTRTYSEGEFRGWLGEAGFGEVTRIDLDPLEKGSLLIAQR